MANESLYEEGQLKPELLTSTQLEKQFKKESPLMEHARTRTKQAFNKRGLLRSSMAAQAGEQAALDIGAKIAQADSKALQADAMQRLRGAQQREIDKMKGDLNLLGEESKSIAFMYNATLSSIGDISASKDIKGADKTKMINQLIKHTNNAASVVGKIRKLKLPLLGEGAVIAPFKI